MIVNKEIPKNKYDPIYKYANKNYSGDSFLVHPDVLLFNGYKYSTRDLCVYLAVASVRPYAEYEAHGNISLPLIKAPLHPHQYLDNRDLLPIKDGLIIFPYEETPPLHKQH